MHGCFSDRAPKPSGPGQRSAENRLGIPLPSTFVRGSPEPPLLTSTGSKTWSMLVSQSGICTGIAKYFTTPSSLFSSGTATDTNFPVTAEGLGTRDTGTEIGIYSRNCVTQHWRYSVLVVTYSPYEHVWLTS